MVSDGSQESVCDFEMSIQDHRNLMWDVVCGVMLQSLFFQYD